MSRFVNFTVNVSKSHRLFSDKPQRRHMKQMLIYLLWFMSISKSESKGISLVVKYKEYPQEGYGIYSPLVVNGETMLALVDTRSMPAVIVWKEWYEGVVGIDACADFLYSCFPCPEPCQRGRTMSFQVGQIDILAFQHSANVFGIDGISFGLINGQDPPPLLFPAANYLGLKPDIDGSGFSLMNQLRDKKVLSTATFTIFLRPTDHPDVFRGKLILGGVDPTQYMIPLRYVPLLSIDDYVVNLHSMAIQEGITTLGINQKATIHTGDNFIWIPQRYFTGLIKEFASAASKIRGQRVDIKLDEEDDEYVMDCSSRKYMPTLTFYLGPAGDVPLDISHAGYVRKNAGAQLCTVMVTDVEGESWGLPAGTLVGNYIEFQPVEMRLGIAKLKPSF